MRMYRFTTLLLCLVLTLLVGACAPASTPPAAAPAAPPAAAPAAPAGFSPPDTRLDWDAALEAVDGDRELLGKVIDGFLGQQPALLVELREALRSGNLPVAKRVAHTVGGSLRLFQGARVVAFANDLEDRCRAGSSEAVEAAWRTLDPELAAVVVELREWLRNQT